MKYVQNEQHFQNILSLIVEKNPESLDGNKLLDWLVYWNEVGNVASHDLFTWDARSKPKLLEEDEFWTWIADKKSKSFLDFRNRRHNFTDVFCEHLRSIEKQCGVYSFWTEGGTPLYVGVSIQLAGRIVTSFSERFSQYFKPIFLRYLVTSGPCDARVLEAYYISLLKPAFNDVGSTPDILTIEIVDCPKLGEPILVNFIITPEKQ